MDVDITCLCGKQATTLTLRSNLPISTTVCHCDSCRHNLGALYHSSWPIKDRPASTSDLKAYCVSKSLTRYFCETCGSHVYEHQPSADSWAVQSGVVERIHSEQVFDGHERIVAHQFVQDTIDGGLSSLLTGDSNDPARSYTQAVGSREVSLEDRAPVQVATIETSMLEASCHCGGVQFVIGRPLPESLEASSPWPDLIVPYHSHSGENPDDAKWWVREGTKWLAGTCACRSCRLSLGSPIQAWAFVARCDIRRVDGSLWSFNTGTLQAFSSSPGVSREFCSRCGATVFWHNDERPGVVDVSVGVLRSKSGASARDFLHWWTDRVSFAENAVDKSLISQLEHNLIKLDI